MLTVGEGKLKAPRGVALDSDDRIYVADTGNHCVQAGARQPALYVM